jgi:hypothetical protein
VSDKKTKGFGILYGAQVSYDEDYDDEDELEDEDDIEVLPAKPQKPVTILGLKINATLFDMIVGAIIFGIACQATIVWFVSDKTGFSLGLWLGIVVAIAYIIHLWWSINRYLYYEATAARAARKYFLLRYFAVAAVLIVAATTNIVQPLAVFLGIMGIKAAALLSLLVPKLMRRQDD